MGGKKTKIEARGAVGEKLIDFALLLMQERRLDVNNSVGGCGGAARESC